MVTSSVFVSCVSSDQASARLLEQSMGDEGIEFLTLVSGGSNSNWQSSYKTYLDDVGCVVVLVGATTHLSQPVAWEISQARERRMPLLGLRLNGTCSPIPDGLDEDDVLDFGTQQARRRLLGILRGPYLSRVAATIRSELSDSELPEGPVDELLVLYAVLLLAKGETVNPEDVHNAWSAWMMRVDPSHSSIVPYTSLDAAIAAQDEPYVRAIQRAARRLAESDD